MKQTTLILQNECLLINHFASLIYQFLQLSKQPQRRIMEPTTPKSFFDKLPESYTFYFDIDPSTPSVPTPLSTPANTILEDALIQAIQAFNIQFKSEGFQLKQDLKLYKPRLVGRNCKPKTDMPALSLFQKICDLKINQIAIQILDRQQAITKLPNKTEQPIESVQEQKQQVQIVINIKEQFSDEEGEQCLQQSLKGLEVSENVKGSDKQ